MKNILLIVAICVLGMGANAQMKPQSAPKDSEGKGHYLNADFGVGLSSLMFKIENGDRKAKIGFAGKIGYDYYFTENWGIGTGLGLSFYKTAGKFNDHLVTYDWADEEGSPYQRNIYLRNWEEIQRSLFLEIPVVANFQMKFGENKRHGIYANAGLRFQLPIKSTYTVTQKDKENNQLEVQAYYKEFDLTINDVMNHGWGFYENEYNGKNTMKFGIAATAAFGGLFGLTEKLDLYVGARCDYGFLNVGSNDHEKIITGDLNTYYGIVGSNVTEKVNPFSIRGELGLRVKLGGKKKAADKKEEALNRQLQYLQTENAKANEDRRKAEDDLRRAEDDRRRAEDDRRRAEDDLRRAEAKIAKAGEVSELSLTAVDGYNIGVVELSNTQKRVLDKKIAILKKSPDAKFSLVGHTCDISSDEVNEKVGLSRAQMVKEYLLANGIEETRIVEISTEGKYSPVVANSNEANRKKNRRVEFLVED